MSDIFAFNGSSNAGWSQPKPILSNSENFYSKCLSLPMYPTLTESEQNKVIDLTVKFLENI